MSSPASPDTILEMIAFWVSIFAAVYFFKKGQKAAGWVSVASVVLLPALVGLFFVSTSQEQKVYNRPLTQVPTQVLQKEVKQPTLVIPVAPSEIVNPVKNIGAVQESDAEWCTRNKPGSTFLMKNNSTGERVCTCQDVGLSSFCEYKGRCVMKPLYSHSHCVQRDDRAWMCDVGYFELGGNCYSLGKMTEKCQEKFGYGYTFTFVKNGMNECTDFSARPMQQRYMPI